MGKLREKAIDAFQDMQGNLHRAMMDVGGSKNEYLNQLEEFEPGLAFVFSMANVLAIETAQGLVLIDSGSIILAHPVYESIRQWSKAPLHTAIFTHGHVDHVFGLEHYEEEEGARKATVIAHVNMPPRFDRYKYTNGYNGHINARQFQLKKPLFASQFRYPDITYSDHKQVVVGGVDFFLSHDKGETDDSTWVWIPKYRALATGDLVIWASPNCGNPQKVQRFAREWAQALRKMQKLNAKYLFPGHGWPIIGEAYVQQLLDDTASYLEDMERQTVDAMNKGYALDRVVQEVHPPWHLLQRPYLKAVYDEPEFVVKNIWRRYGGWYDGNPSHLKPPTDRHLGQELAALCGSWRTLATRAEELSGLAAKGAQFALSPRNGPGSVAFVKVDAAHRMACSLIEHAHHALLAQQQAPEAGAGAGAGEQAGARVNELRELHAMRRQVYTARGEFEASLMSKGIFSAAANSSKRALKQLKSKM